MISDNDLYYTAGLIDGEGSIMLVRRRSGAGRCPCVSVTSTTYELVAYMKETWGGFIINKNKKTDKWKQAWQWQISQDAAMNFIYIIKSYLKEPEKQRRACLIDARYKAVTPRNGKYTPTLREEKRIFEEEFFKNTSRAGDMIHNDY